MAITAVQKLSDAPLQFRGIINHVIEYEATWNPDSVGSNGEFHESVAVPGAVLGDMVLVSIDVDQQDMDVHGYVESAGSVRVGINNATAGAVDLGPCNLHIILFRPVHIVG